MDIKKLILTADVEMEFHGQKIKLQIKKGGISRNRLAEVEQRTKNLVAPAKTKKEKDDPFRDALETLDFSIQMILERLVGWDLTNDGKPLPVSEDSLKTLPSEFIYALNRFLVKGGKSEKTTNETT